MIKVTFINTNGSKRKRLLTEANAWMAHNKAILDNNPPLLGMVFHKALADLKLQRSEASLSMDAGKLSMDIPNEFDSLVKFYTDKYPTLPHTWHQRAVIDIYGKYWNECLWLRTERMKQMFYPHFMYGK